MVLFPNCKINLGLRVAGKRPDGYHNLETIFYPIALNDAAEITVTASRKDHAIPFELTITGLTIPGDLKSNICTKAWQLIANDFAGLAPVKMHLHKAIPIGAGLGGGSADGAITLLLLNQELRLNLSNEQLAKYALTLGSDCPFFIVNRPCYATGRGEVLEEVNIDLKEYYFVVVYPNIHISTAEVFNSLQPAKDNTADIKEILNKPVELWNQYLLNDFELPVFAKHPAIREVKDQLYKAGAAYASLTGTGSSVFAIFHNSKNSSNLPSFEHFKVYTLKRSH